jgi:hypothetical protein
MLLITLLGLCQAYIVSVTSSITSAPQLELPTPDQLLTKDYGFNGQSAYTLTGAIILILTGTFLIFYGYGAFKGLMFVTGAYFFSLLVVSILNTLQARGVTNFEANRDLIYFAIIIPMAILGGLLLLWLWKFGMFVLGALMGFLLGSSILQVTAVSQLLNNELYRWLLMIGLAVVFGIAALYSQKYLIIISSAFVGSFALFMGIDYFVKSGMAMWFYRAANGQGVSGFGGTTIGMAAGFVAVALCSIALQLSHAKRDGK